MRVRFVKYVNKPISTPLDLLITLIYNENSKVFDGELNKYVFRFSTMELFEQVHNYSLKTRIRKVDINV